MESFPASDSPAWGSSTEIPEPDIIVELEGDPETKPVHRRSRIAYIAGAVVAAAGLFALVYHFRRVRR